MAGLSRPKGKIKLEIVKPPSNVHFEEITRHSSSLYKDKLLSALASDSVIAVLTSDSYLRYQFRQAAKKLNLKLLYGEQLDTLYIKPIQLDGEQKRLMLLLREPRTLNELRAAKLQLPLEATLNEMQKAKTTHIYKDKWVLTETGLDLVNTH